MKFSSYFVCSILVVIGVVAHALVAHEQFYPAVTHLTTDKTSLAVMYNFAFALLLLFGKILLRIFIGTLRDVEIEQLVDSGRGFLADTILFLAFYSPTIDDKEVGTLHLIQCICCVIFMKVFHLTAQIRVSHMFDVGVPRLIVNIKLIALMSLLLSLDLVCLQYFYGVVSRSSTFFTWILFEALTMSTVVLVSICKYSVHMVDIRLDNGWPGKLVCLFYIDLVHDVVSMTLFLIFMLAFFVQNPSRLPIYMMADIIQVARKLHQRLRSFRRYRRISANMETRFVNATDEEIDQNEQCVICRESLFDGSKPKKLHCGHIFHIDCLRSWLVMQQLCPTCRAEIPSDAPLAPSHAQPPLTHPVEEEQSPPPQVQGESLDDLSADATQVSSTPLGMSAGSVQVVTSPSSPLMTGSGLVEIDPQAFGLVLGLPPMNEIVESLKRAENTAEFLREQSDFWMDQVRQIERTCVHMQDPNSESGFPMAYMPGHLHRSPFDQTRGFGAAGEAEKSKSSDDVSDLHDQMVEVRRRQREQWEQKRSVNNPSASNA